MQKDSFKLILRSKTFKIPPIFKHITDIPQNISYAMIFSSNHSYEIKSNVSDQVFQSFVGYLINDEMPDISLDNINEFIQINQEFHLLNEIIEQKKSEYGNFLVNLTMLQKKDSNLSYYEREVALNLDEYLEKYGLILLKSRIQSLFNIFNHQQRNLTNHNLAYELILKHFDDTNDSNIFILLESLDGTKFTKSNLDSCISLREKHFNHIPSIKFTYLSKAIENQEKFERKNDEMNNTIDELKCKIERIELKNKKDILELTEQNRNCINKLEEKYFIEIDNLKNKIKKIESQNKNEILLIQEKNKEMEKVIKFLTEKINEIQTQKEDDAKSNENMKNKIECNNKYIETIQNDIYLLKNQIEKDIHYKIANNFFTANFDLNSPGILYQLKKNEKNKFDRFFISSLSSNDICNIIDPNEKHCFCTSSNDIFNLEFELKNKIEICGIKIFSSDSFFPKSFDIVVDGSIVSSVQEANELNCKNGEITINFESILCNKIGFNQTGPNWDKFSKCIHIKKFELLSNENKYSNGVFKSLISEVENHDPHKCDVHISSNYYDFNEFYLLNSKHSIYSLDEQYSWFQIELTRGLVIINGFRLKKNHFNKLKSYKIICTNDVNNEVNAWITLIDIDEKIESEHKSLDIYKLPNPSPPVRYIRLVLTGKNWNEKNFLAIRHFDIFGTYL